MQNRFIILYIGIALFLLGAGMLRRKAWSRHFARSPVLVSRQWKGEFPEASAEDIRKYLTIVAKELGFPNQIYLALAPSDKVVDLAQATTVPPGTADVLELESLVLSLKQHYGLDLSQCKEALTLGEIFSKIRAHQQQGLS